MNFISDAELNGVTFAADSNGFQISLNAVCLEDGVSKSIETMKEALYSPRFTEADFKKVKADLEAYFYSLSKDASNNILDNLFGDYLQSPK